MAALVILASPVCLSAGTIEIMAGKDWSLCEKVAKLFRERLVPDGDLLKSVTWTAVELKGQGPKTSACSKLEKTLIDFDNDGRLDLLVRTVFCMKGAPSESFYLFSADSQVLEQSSWENLAPLLSTPDKFERTGGSYPLSALRIEKAVTPPALTTLFHLQPFILENVAYLSLTDARREWMVIARYLGGERFEDQCYLRAAKF